MSRIAIGAMARVRRHARFDGRSFPTRQRRGLREATTLHPTRETRPQSPGAADAWRRAERCRLASGNEEIDPLASMGGAA